MEKLRQRSADVLPSFMLKGISAAVLAASLLASTHAAAAPSQARVAIDKTRAVFTVAPAAQVDRLIVKFNEGTDVVQSVRGLLNSRNPQVQAELRQIEQRARDEGLSLSRLFARLDADRLSALKRKIEAESGRQLADLNLYFELPIPRGIERARLERIISFLNKQSSVEIAYATTPPQPAAISAPAVTGTAAYDANQGYRQAAPGGIDAAFANTVAGGTGAGVRIADVEGGWRLSHEDMPAVNSLGGAMTDPSWVHHGTAVLGVMGARNNGFGMTGIAYDSSFSVSGIGTQSPAAAILKAGSDVGRGGVLLVEMQQVGPADSTPCSCNTSQCNSLPMEYWPAEFDAIQYVTGQGVTVVEAAGNGSVNLDDPVYNNYFNRSVRDSGAILVGASSSYARAPACFTNFGNRIDLHGWGESVATLGYGDLASGSDDKLYTASFSGTSSATPIVAGAVASVQGVNLARRGDYLTPAAVRSLLRSTGTAQTDSLTSPIGPLPNLRAAIATIAPATTGPVTISGAVFNGQVPATLTSIGGTGANCSVNTSAGSWSCVVPNGWSGTLTPVLAGYTFTPASRSYTGVQANRAAQDFQSTPSSSVLTITGKVTDNGAPVANVQLVASSTSGSMTCNSTQLDGSYRCQFTSGWSGTLSASTPGYSFLPTNRSYTGLTASKVGEDFATPVQNRSATIYYKRGFATPYIHYRPKGGTWTTVPGVAMADDPNYCGYSSKTVDLGSATSVEVAFNDGKGNWDSNKGANYWFSEGESTYAAGTITLGKPTATPCSQSVTFKVSATTVWGENVYVIGNIPALGNWDPAKAVLMSATAYPVWTATVTLGVPQTVEYKYIRKNSAGAVVWEGGANRVLSVTGGAPLTRDDGTFRP